jgi:hypothetical protein
MPKLTDDRMLSCSQLPAIMGHSKWSQPNDVLEYAVKAINGEDPRTDAGEAADWGNKLEPAILAEMARRLGIDKWHSPDRAFKHPTLPLGAPTPSRNPWKEQLFITILVLAFMSLTGILLFLMG